jgi:hypothetical protein
MIWLINLALRVLRIVSVDGPTSEPVPPEPEGRELLNSLAGLFIRLEPGP